MKGYAKPERKCVTPATAAGRLGDLGIWPCSTHYFSIFKHKEPHT